MWNKTTYGKEVAAIVNWISWREEGESDEWRAVSSDQQHSHLFHQNKFTKIKHLLPFPNDIRVSFGFLWLRKNNSENFHFSILNNRIFESNMKNDYEKITVNSSNNKSNHRNNDKSIEIEIRCKDSIVNQ